MKLITPGTAGLFGTLLAILSLLVVVALGLFQPGYNHFTNTISALVAGEMGWVQTLNFFVLSIAIILIGYGLGKSLTGRTYNHIFAIFTLFALFTGLVAFIPTDMVNSQETFRFNQLSNYGRIHYFFVLGIILLAPLMISSILSRMRENRAWKNLIPFTKATLAFNLTVGLFWYLLVSFGYLNEWKGLVQKMLGTIVVVWLSLVGYKLWLQEKGKRSDHLGE